MTTPKIVAVALMGALVLGLWGSTAVGQYYVPLRYDLRYSNNPGYVGAIPYAQAPSRPDPYAFGSPIYSGLDLTGNVRAGRSFRGNVPFGQQGSQVSANLPSMALSNFKRDSIGLEDLGTGVEYGAALPYFPGSGSVTSVGTAERRFAPELPGNRAPYGPPNYNTTNVGLVPLPMAGYYAGSTPPLGVSASAVPMYKPAGLYLPRGAIEWVNALAESQPGLPQPPPVGVPTVSGGIEQLSPETRRMDMRLGVSLPPVDVRIGLPPELGGQAPAQPMAPAEMAAAADRAAADAKARAEAAEAANPSAIVRKLREGAAKEETRGEARPAAAAAPSTAGTQPGGQPAWPPPEQEPGGPTVPPMPAKYTGPASFVEYMDRASAQMKEGRYGAADALYEAALVMDAGRPAALFGRIYALLGDYRYLQAALVLDRAVRLHPEWVNEVPAAASVYPKPETLTRIVDDLKNDLKNRPTNVESNILLGYLYFASDRREEAKPYLKKVAEVRGDKPGSEQTFLKAIEAPVGAK